MPDKKSVDKLFDALQERAKELSCLYRIEETINVPDVSIDEVARVTIEAIPAGCQYVDICTVKIIIENQIYTSSNFKETEWVLSSDIKVQDHIIVSLNVYYSEVRPNADDGPFLKEEVKLAQTIANRLGHFIHHTRMKEVFQGLNSAKRLKFISLMKN